MYKTITVYTFDYTDKLVGLRLVEIIIVVPLAATVAETPCYAQNG